MMRVISAIFLCALLCACGHAEPDSEPELSAEEQLILRVQGSDKLYVTEYVVHKVVTYDDIVSLKGSILNQHFDIKLPQGQRKVLIPMEAHFKAYIDFSGFGPENVTFGPDSTVRVTLPDPQVVLTSSEIDHAGIRSYVDFGRNRFTNAELAEFEQQGRAAIIASVPDLGITATARLHAYEFFIPLLERLGYKRDKITIDFSKNLSNDSYIHQLVRSQTKL